MAMRLTVKEVALAKGIMNATQLGEACGIPLTSMYRIWNNSARMIGLDTLNKLCNFLEVPVGMLLHHVPDKQFSPQPDTPAESSQAQQPRGAKRAATSRNRKE
jgi:DNA-binding Xre family transcriptional regulator